MRRLDDEREWFRYHQLFAEFLQRRLARDHPERIPRLHATASRWFAEHNLLREAVDHAIAAGDDERAKELIELHGVGLTRTRSDVDIAGAGIRSCRSASWPAAPDCNSRPRGRNMLLQRPAAAFAALDAFESAAEKGSLSAPELRHMRIEADVFRAVMGCFTDHIAGVDELVSECLSRPETVPPDVVASAALVASFLEIYRFDFDAARRWQDWADPYHQRASGPFTVIYRYCLAGMASNEELDVAEAERCFREALLVANRSGATHSHAARLAFALLAELVYERGEIDEADRLLDMSDQLGAQGGVVENMIARYVIGARIKAARGDRNAAAGRLDDGARVAATLGLPRLRAHMDNERTRLDLPVTPWAAAEHTAAPRRRAW